MHGESLVKKVDMKQVLVVLWELLGVCSIVLLLYLPNGNTIITNMLTALDIQTKQWDGIGYENLVLIGVFLIVYFTSYKLLSKYSITKRFYLVSSSLMAVTLLTAILFAG